MRKRICLWWFGLILGISGLTCIAAYAFVMGPNLRLAGTTWKLVAFGNIYSHQEAHTDAHLSLSFGSLPSLNIAGESGDPALSGSALCNNFSGSYQVIAPSRIRFSGGFIHTQLACMNSDLEKEHLDAFLSAVHETTSFSMEDKDLLLAYGEEGDYLRLRRDRYTSCWP